MTPAVLQRAPLLYRLECVDACDGLPNDECVNVVCSLVSLHRLKVCHVPEDRIFVGNSVGTEDVASLSSALKGHPNVVSLGQGDVLVLDFAGVFQVSYL